MNRKAAIALVAALTTASPVLACTAPGGGTGVEKEIVTWINAERRARGLGTLRTNAALEKAAQSHACDMVRMQDLTHQSSNGGDLGHRLKKVGYRLRAAVENIARSPETSLAAAKRLWRDSDKHWVNAMNPAISEVGLALATDGVRTYYVFVGGAPR